MTDYFLDTSALVKRYLRETGTAWIKSLTNTAAGNVLIVTEITPVEVIAAIQKRERQGVSNGGISAGAAANARLLFRKELRRFYITPLSLLVLRLAERLPLRYKLRAYDAIQLAAALETTRLFVAQNLPQPVFIASDADLLAAARAEGLTTDNPDAHA